MLLFVLRSSKHLYIIHMYHTFDSSLPAEVQRIEQPPPPVIDCVVVASDGGA